MIGNGVVSTAGPTFSNLMELDQAGHIPGFLRKTIHGTEFKTYQDWRHVSSSGCSTISKVVDISFPFCCLLGS